MIRDTEDLCFCTTCRRHFDVGPVMLKLARTPNVDWDAPLRCPRCNEATVQNAEDVVISTQPQSIN